MRATLALLLLALLPATAAAATLPSTTTRGVKVARSAGGRVSITFADTKAGRAAYKPLAGKRVTLRCQKVGSDLVGGGPQRVASTPVRLGKTVSTIRLRVRGGGNFCSLRSVSVALDTTGRRFLADFQSATAVALGADLLDGRTPAQALRRLGRAGARLATPTATPKTGRVGIYRSGDRTVVASRSPSGRRVFLDTRADVTRTNVVQLFEQIQQDPLPRGAQLPSGDRPPAG